ncbi:MAG: hypothetical protein FRX48_03366 [Lasallia pustulata]|uniref:Histone chaperone domain-containing protein n=1 Tax=Lasallia pustulata TaxID=136370 RepID=A0A5M8PS38_9LECA|nr:MAG: hypothetical protein FRX48_03366 [Lasallia pustulata]
MSDQNGTMMSGTENINPSETINAPKGKGKAVDTSPQDVSMGEDEDSSDEETGAEEDAPEEAEDEEEDDLTEIDTDNIFSDGRRTRGMTIDFAKAAEEAGDELDDDEDDDEDFEEEDKGAMQE